MTCSNRSHATRPDLGPDNSAAVACRRWWQLLGEERIDEAIRSTSRNVHRLDRRRGAPTATLVGHDVTIDFASMARAMGPAPATPRVRTVAVRGDILSLGRLTLEAADGRTRSLLSVVEIDDHGLLAAADVFDDDDLPSAIDALDEHWNARLDAWTHALVAENAATQAWRRYLARVARGEAIDEVSSNRAASMVLAVRGRRHALVRSDTGHLLITTDVDGELSAATDLTGDLSVAMAELDAAFAVHRRRFHGFRDDERGLALAESFRFEHHGRPPLQPGITRADLIEWELLVTARAGVASFVTVTHQVGPNVAIHRVQRAAPGQEPQWPSQILVDRWERGRVVEAHAFDADQHETAWTTAESLAESDDR